MKAKRLSEMKPREKGIIGHIECPEAAMALVEGYGVKVDQAIHQQVLDRCEALYIAPYGGFVNPIMEPVMDADGNVIDVKVTYPNNFAEQMLYYSETFGFLSK